jgi:hypothetical protein
MGRAARQVNVYQGLSLDGKGRKLLAFSCAQFEEVTEREPESTGETCVKKLTA